MNHESARGFIEWAQQEKQPEPWQVEQWKEAIRWFYRAAKSAPAAQLGPGKEISALAEAPGPAGWPAWRKAFLTVARRRHYSYRTEQSYLVWLERFARHVKSEVMEEHTSCGIVLRRICWMQIMTSAPFRNCSGTRM